MANITPRKRPDAMTPRQYQKRLDFCRLWDLVCRDKTQAEIAHELGKDPAWVSRSIKEINADFSRVFVTPDESRIISENLAMFQRLYSEAVNTASAASGYVRTGGFRLAADILRQKAAYQIAVGYVQNRQGREADVHSCPRCAMLDEVAANFTDGEIQAICQEVGLNVSGAA